MGLDTVAQVREAAGRLLRVAKECGIATILVGHVTKEGGIAGSGGLVAPVAFQLGSPRLPNLTALLDEVAAQGAILSINHPGQPSNEDCMGCGWTVETTPADWSRITAIEWSTSVSTVVAPRKYANCAALNKVYKHGVGRTGARDHVSGTSKPVTTFKVSTTIYNANKGMDRDHDGVACEAR